MKLAVLNTHPIQYFVGAKIFGVVLNNVTVHSHDYYYYQRYYHQSNYSKDVDSEETSSATSS